MPGPRTAALAALVLLAACNGPAVPPAQNYATIQGRFFDQATGNGVAGGVVTVLQVLTATSGPDGKYAVRNIAIGQISCSVSPPPGYVLANPTSCPVSSVTPGEVITQDFGLTRHP